MKRILLMLTVSLLFLLYAIPCLAAQITYAPTAVSEAKLLFTKKLGTGYRNAPTPIAAGNDSIYVAAGKKLYKLQSETGDVTASVTMESVSTYTAVPPLLNDDLVYMPLDDGIIQAFSADDLTPVWTYTDPLGGQSLCPIVHEDGYLYTGFWNGETDEANFVCLPAQGSGEQTAVWTFSSVGGFYRTSALLCGDYLVIGSDNGQRVDKPDAPSAIYSFNKKTGKLVSKLQTTGDIRAGVSRDSETGFCYTASKSGILYRFQLNPTGGILSDLKSLPLSGGSTVTPIPCGGRLYISCSNGRKGQFSVLDAKSLQTIYSAELPGSPQGDMLASLAYGEEGGKVLIYATYNAPPGGVYVFEDAPGQKEAAAKVLFNPPEEMGQYCFCPVVADDNGRIFYKNDSGTIFALEGNREANQTMRFLYSILRRLLEIILFLEEFMTR